MTNTETDQPMGRLEKVARVIGGYGLGFIGFGTAIGSIATGNVATGVVGGALGLGMIYGADKILRPYHEEMYGLPPEDESTGRKIGRFATFAGSLGLTYLGAGLVWNAVTPSFITNAGFNFGERIVSGGLGVISLMAGNHVEERSRTKPDTTTRVAGIINNFTSSFKEAFTRTRGKRVARRTGTA